MGREPRILPATRALRGSGDEPEAPVLRNPVVPEPRARQGPSPPTPCRQARIHLITGPWVECAGKQVDLPGSSMRLLALIGLQERPLDRRQAAGMLWPEADAARAAGNLRSALWRLKQIGLDVVEVSRGNLALREGVRTDVQDIAEWTSRLLDGTAGEEDLHVPGWAAQAPLVLPGWDDDWVVFEREHLRQRLLHAVEALSRRLVASGRAPEAVEAALWAVSCEPLRESAQSALITAHLAEGNLIEARRAYASYAALLAEELGVRPGAQLTAMVAGPSGDRRRGGPRAGGAQPG